MRPIYKKRKEKEIVKTFAIDWARARTYKFLNKPKKQEFLKPRVNKTLVDHFYLGCASYSQHDFDTNSVTPDFIRTGMLLYVYPESPNTHRAYKI
jgi:hypothetical protein